MVLPGWNVTEPISAAAKFCQLVQKYRDASQEIRDFASHVDAFRQALEIFDCCLRDPECVDEVRWKLRSVSESCRQCAEHCKAFVDRFLTRYENATPNEIGAANKLLWVWNKEKAISLGEKIQRQLGLINVHVNLAEWRSRQQQQQSSSSSRTSQTPPFPMPITPATLLGGLPVLTPSSSPTLGGVVSPLDPSPFKRQTHPHTQPHLYRALSTDESLEGDLTSNSTLFSDPLTEPQLDARRFSLPEPTRALYRWDPEMTMANLVGASIHRKNGSRPPFPISRIEFLRDFDDNLRYIVSSHANVRLFQKLSRSPPSIPHTEHPIAYKGQRLLRVKFLGPHEVILHQAPASVSATARRNLSVLTPIALGSPAIPAISSTLASSSTVRSPFTVGSPSLPIDGSRISRATPHPPMYEFRHHKDYQQFQEHVMGRVLLVNAPIETIESKPVDSSRLRKESEKQYLRLWAHNRMQTIMYSANSQAPSPVYVEHDVEYFYPNEPKSSSTRLVLAVKRTGWRQLSEALRALDHLVIVFSDAQDKTRFMAKAEFYGTPNPAMIPPPLLD